MEPNMEQANVQARGQAMKPGIDPTMYVSNDQSIEPLIEADIQPIMLPM